MVLTMMMLKMVLTLMMELRDAPEWPALTKADPSLPVWLGQVRWKLGSISVWLIILYTGSHPPHHMLYITSFLSPLLVTVVRALSWKENMDGIRCPLLWNIFSINFNPISYYIRPFISWAGFKILCRHLDICQYIIFSKPVRLNPEMWPEYPRWDERKDLFNWIE